MMERDLLSEKIAESMEKYSFRNKKVLIISDDNTRSTPVGDYFPLIKRMIENDSCESIDVLFALGTHRPMNEDEIMKKMGLSSLEGIGCHNHDWLNEDDLISIGNFGGYECKLNRKIFESDVVIGFSNTVPHRVAGFSGGAKLFCPGVSNKDMIGYTHWVSAKIPLLEIAGTLDNPVRFIFDKIDGSIDKEKISFNFVMHNNYVMDVFIGDFKEAHAKASRLSERYHIKEMAPTDKVMVYVDDIVPDLWQGAKAIYNCSNAVSDGGLLVVKGRFKEGISVHGDILKYGYHNFNTVQGLIKEDSKLDIAVAAHLIHVGELLERINIKICSDNISEQQCKKMNLGYITDEEASRMNFGYKIPDSTHIYIKSKQG